MDYIISTVVLFLFAMLITQIILFEMTKSKAKKENNVLWYLSLDKPFQYNRFKMMTYIVAFVYIFVGDNKSIFTLQGLLYFLLLLAMVIVADMTTHYLMIKYGKVVCKKEIALAKELKSEVETFEQNVYEDENYEVPVKQYDEKEILKKYVEPTSHLAYLSVDGGKFVRECNLFTEATFDVEPFGDIEAIRTSLEDLPVQVTKLTPSKQMPFKDERMDVVMCQYSNYEKHEVKRVLKNGGYFVVNQNGTSNLKELFKMYMPFRVKGVWDAFACCGTLEEAEMKIVEKYEEHGTLKFPTLASLYTYFKCNAQDFSDVKKYQLFYIQALKQIKETGWFELTTHRFLVVAQK